MSIDLSTLTARNALGSADLLPCFRRDEGAKKVEVLDWERRPAALALAALPGWGVDRVARATGLRNEEVREVLQAHAPELLAAPPAEPAIERSESPSRLPLASLGVSSTRKKGPRMTTPPFDVREHIAALNSRLDRQAERIQELQTFLAERTKERDAARSFGVRVEQQLDQIRAGLVTSAGEVRLFPERHTDEYVRGQYETLIDVLADFLEVTGEHYPDQGSAEASESLAEAFEAGTLAGHMLPEALELDDDAREEALRDEYRSVAGAAA
jgi:DNA-binding transcriptional MerR regulator